MYKYFKKILGNSTMSSFGSSIISVPSFTYVPAETSCLKTICISKDICFIFFLSLMNGKNILREMFLKNVAESNRIKKGTFPIDGLFVYIVAHWKSICYLIVVC